VCKIHSPLSCAVLTFAPAILLSVEGIRMSDLDALDEIYETSKHVSSTPCHKNQARARSQFGKRMRHVRHSNLQRAMQAVKSTKAAPITLAKLRLPE
jgi:hypothetical protein